MGLKVYPTAATSGSVGSYNTFTGGGEAPPAPVGDNLTGNPFIDNWGTPDPADDEFDAGGDNMDERGWDVWNMTDGIHMAWSQKVDISSLPNPDTYWSSRTGTYMAIQLPPGKRCAFLRPVAQAGGGSDTHSLRFGRPWFRTMYDFSDYGPRTTPAVIQNGLLFMHQYNGAIGSNPALASSYSSAYVGIDDNRPRFGLDGSQSSPGSTFIPDDAFTRADLLDINLLMTGRSSAGITRFWGFNAESASIRAYYDSNKQNIITPTRVGFSFSHDVSVSVLLVDYMRYRRANWFGFNKY